jgi:hypothetical protein
MFEGISTRYQDALNTALHRVETREKILRSVILASGAFVYWDSLADIVGMGMNKLLFENSRWKRC